MEKLGEVPVAVVEKGKVCGAHTLSGANMVPVGDAGAVPGPRSRSDWPFAYQEVTKDAVYLLTKKAALPLKPMPPNFRNHGNYVISVSKLSRFLAEQAEEKGAYILTETVADKLLVEDRIVRGIRSGDRGRGKDGEELGNFEPGSDVVAKAHRPRRGHARPPDPGARSTTSTSTARCRCAGSSASRRSGRSRSRSTGSSTRWAGRCASARKCNEFGGSFIYPMGEDKLCIGMVDRPRLHRLDPLLPRPAPAAEDAPVRQEDARGRQARRLGREDDPLRRLLLDAAQPRRARAWRSPATRRAWSTSRR